MSAFLTELPEDPHYAWRIHVVFDQERSIKDDASPWYIKLTDEELRGVVKAYFDSQDADDPCVACGKEQRFHWEDEPVDQWDAEE